jgi:hypothetical protein
MARITGLKNWKENETLTAQAYVYERNTIVDVVNEHDERIEGLEGRQFQFIFVQAEAPPEDANDFDLWFKIIT